MNEDIALSINHVSKTFRLPHERKNTLKEWVVHFRKPSFEKLHALNDINVEIKRGEFFGIVGRNGSGKSTLLKIIGGIYQPTTGSVKINGTLTPFIELGIGFNPELTGRENVFLNGAILGLTHKEVAAKYDGIVAFAELDKFMDQKLKNYSSGMQVRLAFSIAIQAHNDILLIDEVLAVGDSAFQKKCFDVFKAIKKAGKTVVFVTHDMSAVEEYCDRAMLIEKSHIVSMGKSYHVAREYRRLLNESDRIGASSSHNRFGTGQAEVLSAQLETVESQPIKKLADDQKHAYFRMKVRFNEETTNPIFGITLRDAAGMPLFISNTKALHQKTGNFIKGQEVSVSWKLENVLNNGRYTISPAVAAEDAVTMYDWREDLVSFEVVKDYYLPGPICFDHDIEVK